MIAIKGGAPLVVAFTGLPGTGKSTMADATAKAIGAPSFSGDWLLGALVPSGVLTGLPRPATLELYWRLLRTLVTRQLMLGQSAVLDCLVTDEIAGEWRELAAELGARLVVVQCVCSDEQLHRSRVDGRQRGIPGWHEIDWAHVERMRAEFPPVRSEHTTVDAVHPLADNLRTVLELIAG